MNRLKRREFLFLSGSLSVSWAVWAETEGYKTIDWNDLMPDPWVKEMTKEMAAISKLSYLQDNSEEANKAMGAIRKKLDEAPIVKSQINKKVRLPGYAVPLDADRSDKHRRPPTKLCLCDRQRKARSKKCPNPWMCCGSRESSKRGVSARRRASVAICWKPLALPRTKPSPPSADLQ
jgi:hypothetical protein